MLIDGSKIYLIGKHVGCERRSSRLRTLIAWPVHPTHPTHLSHPTHPTHPVSISASVRVDYFHGGGPRGEAVTLDMWSRKGSGPAAGLS